MSPPSASEDNPSAGDATPVRFYGRRKGKPLKATRQGLLETLLPRLRIAVPVQARSLDPRTLFPAPVDEVRLEIGFGGGEHLAAQAAANRDVGFIGSEVFLNGVASFLRHAADHALENVRVHDDDVRLLLPSLRDGSLARISLLFPDPWPKARHAKRRFISPAMLDELARLLCDGGELRVASDHAVYIDWALQHGTAHPAFQWTAKGPDDWRVRPVDSIASRYEEKALKEGRKPAFLNFSRRPRGAETTAK